MEDWASFLSQFTELSKKISSESDGLQARRFAEVLENLEKRYKILSKGVMNKKNQNDILVNENQENIRNINITVSWAEDCLALITKQVNVSDVDQLLQTISRLEKAQAEAIKQRLALDEYSGQVGVNNPVYQQSRGKVERIKALRASDNTKAVRVIAGRYLCLGAGGAGGTVFVLISSIDDCR